MRESSLSTVISISLFLCNCLASLSHFQLYNYQALIQVAHLFDANTVKIVYQQFLPSTSPPVCPSFALSFYWQTNRLALCATVYFAAQSSLFHTFFFGFSFSFWYFKQLSHRRPFNQINCIVFPNQFLTAEIALFL